MTRNEALEAVDFIPTTKLHTPIIEVLNKIYDNFEQDIDQVKDELENLQRKYDKLDYKYTQLKDDNANS